MKIHNVHEREFGASAARVGALIDMLGRADSFWPEDRWPALRFDSALAVGAAGGHGAIRYTVDAYDPGRSIQFRFTRPHGFVGIHRFDVAPLGADTARLRHTLSVRAAGKMLFIWLLLLRPLHDALLEDALDRAEWALQPGAQATPRRWSVWVRLFRWLLQRSGPGRGRGLRTEL